MNQKEFQTKILNGYSKIHELKLVSIGLASPEKIQSWAEKELPNGKIFGEVTNPNTFHYKSFKPTKGGLFCERIFGPIKDFECACGKRQKPNSFESKKILQHQKTTRFFCPVCDVEYTWSIIRRYQLGYIKLHTPVAHLWYFKNNPSYLSVFFDMRKKDLESIIYCMNGITIENVWKANLQELNFQRSPTDLYQIWQKFFNFEQKKKKYKFLLQHDRDHQKFQKTNFRKSVFQLLEKNENLQKRSPSIWKKTKEAETTTNFVLKSKQNWKQRPNIFFQSQTLKSFQDQKSQNQLNFSYPLLFSSNQKLFILLQKHKMKQRTTLSFQNTFKEEVKKSFENGATNLFAKNILQLQPFPCLSDQNVLKQTSQTVDFLKIFLFSKDRKYFLRFYQSTNSSDFQSFDILNQLEKISPQKTEIIYQKSIFWFSLCSTFLSQKQQKIKNRKKLSKKELLVLINFIPILQQVEFSSQEKLLKLSLLKNFFQFEQTKKHLVSSSPVNNIFPIPLSNLLAKRQKQESEKSFSHLFQTEKNFIEPSKTTSENITSLQKKSKVQLYNLLKKFVNEKKYVISSQVFQTNEKNLQIFSLKFQKILNFFQIVKKIQFFHVLQSQNKFPIKPFQNLFFEYFFTFFVTKNLFETNKNLNLSLKFQKSSLLFHDFQINFLFFQNLYLSIFENQFRDFSFHQSNSFLSKSLNVQNNQTIRKKGECKIENPSYGLRKKIQEKTIKLSKNFRFQDVFFSANFFEKNQKVLKNPVVVLSYQFIWENDSDWKYFLYYYSFFFSDFQDIPIFAYRNIFPFFLQDTQKFLVHSTSVPSQDHAFFNFRNSTLETKSFFGGAGIFEKCLADYSIEELKKMIKQHQILLPKLTQTIEFLKQTSQKKKEIAKLQKYFQKREHIIRRLKLLRKFFRNHSNPKYFLLKNLPVLPPDLRPILKLENQIAASDLNRFYQRILYRNDRIKKFAKDSATNQSFEMKYAQRLLQEAVDNLIQNGKGAGKAETNSRGQPLKSLSEILKGKQGRFRQYLLGKRVDYSGRSVIVVGPKLKVYECGIPQEMALELFLPFLIQKILQLKLAQTVIGAKNLLKNDSTLALHFLQKILKNIPVLLNRAPTLHKLGFQAFLPKLVEGRAILLHPMVCPGFNADFDGDQMAVHIPLTVEARTEAWKFMLSFNNFINSATGEPNLLPSQDMVLGSYYLTVDYLKKFSILSLFDFLKTKEIPSSRNQKNIFLVFQNFQEVFLAYQKQKVFLHTPVWVKVSLDVNFGNDLFKPREFRFSKNGQIQKIYGKSILLETSENQLRSRFIRTTAGRILMNFMIQECISS